MSNIFNTQDKAFHAKYTKPILGFWSMSKVLELEPLLDETLQMFVQRLNDDFAKKGAVCMLENWLSYCESSHGPLGYAFLLTSAVTWDAMANVSFGRPYGFIEEGGDVGNIISESTAGLKYFAAVSNVHDPVSLTFFVSSYPSSRSLKFPGWMSGLTRTPSIESVRGRLSPALSTPCEFSQSINNKSLPAK